MTKKIILIVGALIALGVLGGCSYRASWGADQVVQVHNSIEDTILTNITVDGTPYGFTDVDGKLVATPTMVDMGTGVTARIRGL